MAVLHAFARDLRKLTYVHLAAAASRKMGWA